MKKLLRSLSAVTAAILCVGMMSLSVAAATTRENASTPEAARPSATVAEPAPASAPAPNVSGSYHAPSRAKAIEKVKPSAFLAPMVYVDPVTHAISNVYDADGNLIPATLSSDGHFYIVPTNEGYLYIGTGY